MNVVAPIVVGIAFGWILQRAELSHYERIVGVYRLRDLTVMKFLGTALATAAIGVRLVESLGLAPPIPLPLTYVVGNLAGGAVFGIGMSLSGFCPGTVAAGAGEGRIDYLVPGMLGLFAGAVVYGLAYDAAMPVLAKDARAITIAQLLDAEPWLVVVVVAELALIGLYLLERRPPRHRSLRRRTST